MQGECKSNLFEFAESQPKSCKQLAEALEIDTPMYCKIERGSRPIKRTQVVTLAKFLFIDETELLTLWLVDKVLDVLVGENELA